MLVLVVLVLVLVVVVLCIGGKGGLYFLQAALTATRLKVPFSIWVKVF